MQYSDLLPYFKLISHDSLFSYNMAEELIEALKSNETLEELKEVLKNQLKLYTATCPDLSCSVGYRKI